MLSKLLLIINRYKKFIKSSILNIFYSPLGRIITDMLYLKIIYLLRQRKILNFNNPESFNEKLQWLKLNDRKPIYTNMVDKYEAKQYVAEKIGYEYIIPTLDVWSSFNDIEFDELPDKFVLKCTHDSGGLVICNNKSELDINKARIKINKSLRRNFYYIGREWPYKNVKPRIIAEQFMESKNEKAGLIDYKFFCFDGVPKFLYVSENLTDHDNARISFASLDWQKEPFYRSDYVPYDTLPNKPLNLDKMIELATKLSEGIKFIRVDLYEVNRKIYFSELTFFPCNGLFPFEPNEWDYKLGSLIKL